MDLNFYMQLANDLKNVSYELIVKYIMDSSTIIY